MAKIHPGATLTPYFDDFLPDWLAKQSWYTGEGPPSLTPVGYFRFEDPAGAVGVETHLLKAGSMVFQVPMTYRDAPLDVPAEDPQPRLITTAEHSVLGTRWIYDAEYDPVWISETLRLVRDGAVAEPSRKASAPPAKARGHRVAAAMNDDLTIALQRVIAPSPPPGPDHAVAALMGTWHPEGADSPSVKGCLAVIRERTT